MTEDGMQKPDTLSIIEAYESYAGDIEHFVYWWNRYLKGDDFPCRESLDGIHQVFDGACNLCGDRVRN